MEEIQISEESIFKIINSKGNIFNNSEKKEECISLILASEDSKGLKRALLFNRNLSTKVRKTIVSRLQELKNNIQE